MRKPKLLIIVLFQNLLDAKPYYARNPAPPLPGILLAGMTPPVVEVEVLHEMVRPINFSTDAEFVALSFMDYCALHAYDVAARFRAAGKTVVGGGKFASTFPDEVEPHFDSILVGEAQGIWPRMVLDMVSGSLRKRYTANPGSSLQDIPPPRYDLVEPAYIAPIVTEASRGCPHPCTYCQLNIRKLPYKTRPISDVIRDLTNTIGLPWFKTKMAMLLDNNLGGDVQYAKDLLREIAKLSFWAIGVQFSIECLRDDGFVESLAAARCRMAFIGMESLNTPSLTSVQKKQNRVAEYKAALEKLHRRGILTFTGMMFALAEDTLEYYETLPEKLDDVGNCVILPSISIPIYGTPWYRQVEAEGRIIDRDLSHYEGDHLVFVHPHLSEEQIYQAYESVNRVFYAWPKIVKRWWQFMKLQSIQEPLPQFLLKILLTSFIYLKLSIFQRHHAQQRVFKEIQRDNKGRDGKARRFERPGGLCLEG